MKNWFLGLLTGLILVPVLVILAGVASWYAWQRGPQVQQNSTLVLDLEGDYPEQVPTDVAGQILGQPQQITLLDVVRTIEKASRDPRITGILLEPRSLTIGWGKLQQLRQSLDEFQKRGKKITAVLDEPTAHEYYLASVSKRIYLSPAGVLDLKGMRVEVMLFKDTLSKLGIQADLERIGAYKNFADQFTTDHMSDAFREATTSMLDSIYGGFIQTVAQARGKPPNQVQQLIEQDGPFDPQAALAAGLVDKLGYQDEAIGQLQKESGDGQLHQIKLEDYQRVPESSVGMDKGDRIALVYAVGDIASGEDSTDPLEGKTMGSETMAEVLDEVGNDSSIKGVLVRIDSPGGDAFASDDIWRRMNLLHKKKPLVFSMSDDAASGGYYIAMTGDPIVAEPATLTGSIGIVYGKLDLKGFYQKLGINKEIIAHGPFSTLDSDWGPYTPQQLQRVDSLMEDFYQDFINKVAVARSKTPEQINQIGQGRVWTGEQAKQNGLVDQVGGLDQALDLLKQKAGIAASAPVQLVEFPQRKSLLELLVNRAEGGQASLPVSFARWFVYLQRVELLVRLEAMSHQPLWARLPAKFDFR